MRERLTNKQAEEIRELIHEWRPFVNDLRDPLERTLLSEQAGWAEVDRLTRLVASLQEQLSQANACAAHWACLYHAEETRFQRQNTEIEQLRSDRAQLIMNLESRIDDQLRWETPVGNEIARELRSILNEIKVGDPHAGQGG
jgi:hypothetical protein